MNFKTRSRKGEAMDDPALDAAQLEAVFRDLNRTNHLLGGQEITLRAIQSVISRFPKKSYSIVDMGCGDGDLLRRIAKYSRVSGIPVNLLGIDNSRAALEIAADRSRGFPEIRFQEADLPDLGGMTFPCDILLCTLTLHHFTDEEVPQVLEQFTSMASLAVIINDLQRNRLAYYLFQLFSLIFIKTKIAKQDGLISISRGFLRRELQAYSMTIPNCDHRIRWRWIFRYLWVMQIKGVPIHE